MTLEKFSFTYKMFVLTTLICFFTTLVFLYFRKKHNYFSHHKIASAPGYFPLGSKIIWKCFTGQQSILQVPDDLCDDFPKTIKAFGYYKAFGEPVLVLKDLELAKRIMVQNFDHFIDRSFLTIHPDANAYSSLFLTNIQGTVFENHRKSLIQSEASYVYILRGQKLIKNAKNGPI